MQEKKEKEDKQIECMKRSNKLQNFVAAFERFRLLYSCDHFAHDENESDRRIRVSRDMFERMSNRILNKSIFTLRKDATGSQIFIR